MTFFCVPRTGNFSDWNENNLIHNNLDYLKVNYDIRFLGI